MTMENDQNTAGVWQTIESAPKNGTEILGWREDCGTLLICWTAPIEICSEQELDEIEVDAAEQYGWFYADFVAGGRLEGDEIPTLWTHLPEPTPPSPTVGETENV